MVAQVLRAGTVDEEGQGLPQAPRVGQGPVAHRRAHEGVGPKAKGEEEKEGQGQKGAPHGGLVYTPPGEAD